MQKPILAKRLQLGPISKKVLILLGTGIALGLSSRPDQYFRILKSAADEWRGIDKRNLRDSIRRLYQSKLIGYKECENGDVALTITNSGKQKVLRYNIDTLRLKKAKEWDKQWRIVISDIPEHKKGERNAFAATLKRLGFHPLQKSVYIYPHDCKDEVDFITEIYNLRPYVRFIIAQEIDTALELKQKFKLTQ